MTQPRRPDELLLWDHVYRRGPYNGKPSVYALAQYLDINLKRAEYLCDKWTRKGWFDWGINPLWGWTTEEAPKKLE